MKKDNQEISINKCFVLKFYPYDSSEHDKTRQTELIIGMDLEGSPFHRNEKFDLGILFKYDKDGVPSIRFAKSVFVLKGDLNALRDRGNYHNIDEVILQYGGDIQALYPKHKFDSIVKTHVLIL